VQKEIAGNSLVNKPKKMMRRIFTSSSTDEDVLDTMEDFEKHKHYSTTYSGSEISHDGDLTPPTIDDDSAALKSTTTLSSYFDIFNKVSTEKSHLNKVTSVSIDFKNRNDTLYTSGMDGLACRWKINHNHQKKNLSGKTSPTSENAEDDSMELDFLYERQTGPILSQFLFNEFLFIGGIDEYLSVFYIHNEKPMTRLKCNSPVTSIFAFEYMANDFNIVGSVCVGLRNGEINMYSILKQYNKVGKWIGTALLPNEQFNKNNILKHSRQINSISICSGKEIIDSYELQKQYVASQKGSTLQVSSSNSANLHDKSTPSTPTTTNPPSATEPATVKMQGGPYFDPLLIVSAGNDCFVKIWSPSTGDLLFVKEFDSPCMKVATTSFTKDDAKVRFFFVAHYNDTSIFSVSSKSKKPSDFRVHFNINQFFLHQVSENFDQHLKSSNFSPATPRSKRDRGYSTAISFKEEVLTQKTLHGNSTMEPSVSKNGYLYLIGWNSMQARLEIWLYNLFDQKTKPVSQFQQKLYDVTYLTQLSLERSRVYQNGTDLITEFTLVYSTFKKANIKHISLKKPLVDVQQNRRSVTPGSTAPVNINLDSIVLPKTTFAGSQRYFEEFSDLFTMVTTKKSIEMRNPIKIAQTIQNCAEQLKAIPNIGK